MTDQTRKNSLNRFKHEAGPVPVDGMTRLAARVIADLDMALIQLHCDVIIVSVIKKDTVVLCGRHLRRELA